MGFFSRWASFRDYLCKLKRWAYSRDGHLFEITFANSRGGLLFKRSAVVIEADDYKIISKTTTQICQPRNMLKCQIIFKKNTNLIVYSLEKKPRYGLLLDITFAKLNSGGLLLKIKPTGRIFEVLRYTNP